MGDGAVCGRVVRISCVRSSTNRWILDSLVVYMHVYMCMVGELVIKIFGWLGNHQSNTSNYIFNHRKGLGNLYL